MGYWSTLQRSACRPKPIFCTKVPGHRTGRHSVGRGMGRWASCCAVVALAVAGCGSSKSDNNTNTTSSSGGVVAQPKPTQPISAVVAPLNKALKDQSCPEFAAIDFSQGRQDTTPGAPPTGTECKFMNQALKGSKELKFTHG